MNESGLFLDVELKNLLLSAEEGRKDNCRNANLISSYLGFDGCGGSSMEAAGKPYGISRERVRQIHDKLMRDVILKYEQNIELKSFISSAISLVEKNIPASFSLLEKKFFDAGFIREAFNFNGFVNFLGSMGIDSPFLRVKVSDSEFAIPKLIELTKSEEVKRKSKKYIVECGLADDNLRLINHFSYKNDALNKIAMSPASRLKIIKPLDISKIVTHYSVKNIVHNGAVSFEHVVNLTHEDFPFIDKRVLFDFAFDLCSARSDFCNLGFVDGEHWFWFNEAGRNRLYSYSRKSISVARKITIPSLMTEIMSKVKDFDFSIPNEVLKKIMVSRGEFVEDGDSLVCASEPSLGEILTDCEKTMVDVMMEHEKLNQRVFSSICSERGVKPYSFSIILNYQPLFKKLSRGEYTLIG